MQTETCLRSYGFDEVLIRFYQGVHWVLMGFSQGFNKVTLLRPRYTLDSHAPGSRLQSPVHAGTPDVPRIEDPDQRDPVVFFGQVVF